MFPSLIGSIEINMPHACFLQEVMFPSLIGSIEIAVDQMIGGERVEVSIPYRKYRNPATG